MHHHTRAYAEALHADRLRTSTERPRLDHGTVAEIVAQFTARIRAVARRHRLADHDVDDVIQATWVMLLEQGSSIREPRAVGAWLETTARRESLRLLGRARRERPTDRHLAADEPTPPVDEQRLVAAEQRAALTAAGAELTYRQQEVLAVLLVDPAPSYAEMAKLLGIPIGSIGPTRARILDRLRAHPQLAAVVADTGKA